MKYMMILAFLLMLPLTALAETAGNEITMETLLEDMAAAYDKPSGDAVSRMDRDAEALGDDTAVLIAEQWKQVYLNPDYRLLVHGKDDPSEMGIQNMDRHAFVILGYELKDGEMTPELVGRCDAAAAAAAAFPEAILICSGGPTGENNPDNHTEAGLMRDYLVDACGISPERIYIDDRAMTTADNAVNTFDILRRQGMRTMTIITSAYHLKRGQVLYGAVGAKYRRKYGYMAEIVSNYCVDVEPANPALKNDGHLAVLQLGQILELPDEDMEKLSNVLFDGQAPGKKP